MLADQTRKIQKNNTFNNKIRYRSLWVLKSIHRESIARETLNVRATHQARLYKLISEGCKIIGYVRKLPGKESITTRLRLLESMVDKLVKASSVEMVFGSYSSASDEIFVKRDTTKTTVIPRTKGNTQDFLQFLAAANYPVTIVAIDFAGLTTNKPDLIQFLRDHKAVKNIVIDNIESQNKTYHLTREQILSDETVLQLFDCRSAPVRRSLMP
ncbi:hypothetical protein INT47_007333 [Mucor saturninus]|uniref:Uncharacterized protein n=1 Tax=Mucor saturninus TaxID=64648 RepID=A0A8H7V9M9_9FUNG|nr:hypothetical protein INT47_007333 [Mucor saturninus]